MTSQKDITKQNAPNKKPLKTAMILGGILLLGMILRISYLREITNDPRFHFPLMDDRFHDYWARGLATGDWTVTENPFGFADPEIRTNPYIRPPAYPFFLAAVYYISNCSPLAARIVQMSVGLVSCMIAFLLGKRLFGRHCGLVYAALMSVYWVFIYFEGELLAPVLLVLLGLLLIYVLNLWYDRPEMGRAFVGGICLGLFAIASPNILLFSPMVLWWFWWTAKRRDIRKGTFASWLGFALGAMLVICPVSIRNYIVAHDFVFITSNAGINLYIGNNEKSNGSSPYIPVMEEITGLGRTGWRSSDYPRIVRGVGLLEGKEMKPSEVSAYFTRKALGYIRQNPKRVLKLMAIKAALFWGPIEMSNNKEVQCEKVNSLTLRYLPGFPMVISLAVVGFVRLFSGCKKQFREKKTFVAVTQKQFEISVLILFFIITYFISYLPFFVTGRYRVPVIPFLLLFGAYGLCHTVGLLGEHDVRSVFGWLFIYIALYIFTGRPAIPYHSDRAAYHNQRGVCYMLSGQFDHAIDEYRKALQVRPESVLLRKNLSKALQKQGRFDEAAACLNEGLTVLEDIENKAKVYFNLALLYDQLNRPEAAIRNYHELLELEPEHLQALQRLSWILATTENTELRNPGEAIRLAKRACNLTNHRQPGPLDTLAVAYASDGRFTEAIETAGLAIKQAEDAGREEQARKIRDRLNLYKKAKAPLGVKFRGK